MEEVLEKTKKTEKNEEDKIAKETQNKEKKIHQDTEKFTIFGMTPSRLIWYFVIYSVLGFIIETIFGMLTKGVIESRKSFLYGPFCGIYGLGAIVMIIGLQYFKKNNYTLFFGGFLIGSIVEYIVSLVGEYVYHIKWWDYSTMPFNLNGRICVWFSLAWGILAIYLMTSIHPKIDHFIDRFTPKTIRTLAIISVILLMIDSMITGVALKMFFTRLVQNYQLELQNVDNYMIDYEKLYQHPTIKQIVDHWFTDEKILKTFPNIKVTGKEGNIIYVCDVLKDIQPYYVRIFTPRLPK
ncbi:MAG: putative ABC transporter permease [Clostridia bacterium]